MEQHSEIQETPETESADGAGEVALPMTDIALLERLRDGLKEQL